MSLSCAFSSHLYRYSRGCLLALASLIFAAALAGCGTSGSPTPAPGAPPAQPAGTTVVLMLAATGNDRLTSWNGMLNSLSLTSQSGHTINVFSSSPYQASPEFHHLNGGTEPFVTVTVPEDTYTSATVTMGYTQFSCAAYVPGANGGLNNEVFADTGIANNQITVTVPTSLTINQPTGLALDLQEAASAAFPTCVQSGVPSYSITPAFQLVQLPFGALPSNVVNGEAATLLGTISSVASGGASLTITLPDGPTLSVGISTGTTLQGITSAASLTVGEAVSIDIDFNADASITASRIEVLDPDTTNLTTALGTIEFISNAQPSLSMTTTQVQGALAGSLSNGYGVSFSFGSATFGIYGGSTMLGDLPFTPAFTAANMVPGQNVLLTTHATAISGGPLYQPATTATLMPQTVDAIVTGIQTAGMLTTYTVSLASYDLFPNLASQSGQNSRIASPSGMAIYTYSGNDGLPSGSIATGKTYRFTGLVFNDNGVLRMACSQILSGVAQ